MSSGCRAHRRQDCRDPTRHAGEALAVEAAENGGVRVIEGEPAVFAAHIRRQGCRIDAGAQAQGQDLTGRSKARILAGDEFSQVGRERLGLGRGLRDEVFADHEIGVVVGEDAEVADENDAFEVGLLRGLQEVVGALEAGVEDTRLVFALGKVVALGRGGEVDDGIDAGAEPAQGVEVENIAGLRAVGRVQVGGENVMLVGEFGQQGTTDKTGGAGNSYEQGRSSR